MGGAVGNCGSEVEGKEVALMSMCQGRLSVHEYFVALNLLNSIGFTPQL